ncbi:MAG: hypothetical protein H6735_14100 [Alphaproteobacteria bacterium]|nr:hypothetical protein [Alphaproteobacteria bacterium]
MKSQNDPSLVYSCRITYEGDYSCCTQNLNVCGGLRGSVCKHILVLTIGLVQGKALSSAAALALAEGDRDEARGAGQRTPRAR